MKRFLFCLIFVYFSGVSSWCSSDDLVLEGGAKLILVEDVFSEKQFDVYIADVFRINDQYPFGEDGRIPKDYLKLARIEIEDRVYSLEVSNMYNTSGKRRVYGGCDSNMWCSVRAVFSQGGGQYAVEWKVRNGVATRTVLTDSGDVVDLFLNGLNQ